MFEIILCIITIFFIYRVVVLFKIGSVPQTSPSLSAFSLRSRSFSSTRPTFLLT